MIGLIPLLLVKMNHESTRDFFPKNIADRFLLTRVDSEEETHQICARQTFHICLLDLDLSEKVVFNLVRYLKTQDPLIKIVLVSDHASIEMLLQAIRLQVADFILKPYEDEFLLERLEEVHQTYLMQKAKEDQIAKFSLWLINNGGAPAGTLNNETNHHNSYQLNDQIMQYKNMVLDLETRQVFLNGNEEYVLTQTCFNYLKVLMQHAPRAVSFTNLVKEAQGYQLSTQEAKSLAFWHIYKLRSVFSNQHETKMFRNVRGYGYKLELE